MTNSWEGFLDIIELYPNIRQKANLQILMDFPNGHPNESLLLSLFEKIEVIYGGKRCTILWWNNGRIYNKTISKDNLRYLQYLWDRIAGNYLLFLPEKFYVKRKNVEDEEEFIGECLVKYSHLILKTEDAYVALYLYINK
ncbi:hypothetical protein [Cytobacillus firmus]|uniref:hypothetical protein n=1 Tax=Cytobacillus firmus TaxID=1399 RepID=UPI0018CEE7FF|nr:hypothetical protein [Cytobacillus firmus]MBG9587250.1 hypothetical protein [Cytobacillus firmus]